MRAEGGFDVAVHHVCDVEAVGAPSRRGAAAWVEVRHVPLGRRVSLGWLGGHGERGGCEDGEEGG